MSEVKRFYFSVEDLGAVADGKTDCTYALQSAGFYVQASDFDRLTAECKALQERLNAADQSEDDLQFQLNDREGSRRDWFDAAQAAEKRVEVLEAKLADQKKRHTEDLQLSRRRFCWGSQLQAKLAERDALLADVSVSVTGRNGTFARIPADWFDRRDALSASAEPAKSQLVECDACPRSGGCVGSCMKAPASAELTAPVERDLDDDPFFVQQAEPHKPAPNPERDERAEFEGFYLREVAVSNDSLRKDHAGHYHNDTAMAAWSGWQARAALERKKDNCELCGVTGIEPCTDCPGLDKATEGASHE